MIGQWRRKVEGEKEGEGRTEEGKEKEDGAEPHGLEKPQVARDLIAGQYISVLVDLFNLSTYNL